MRLGHGFYNFARGCPWRGKGGQGGSLSSQGNGPAGLEGLLAAVREMAKAGQGGWFETHGLHGLIQFSFNPPARLVASRV